MNIEKEYKICAQCIMDTLGNPEIHFDEHGVCNYCHEYTEKAKVRLIAPEEREKRLNEVIEKIKKSGKGNQYDCVIGISGGVDSTYVAFMVKKYGLRPLAVHFDNGWNSEVAVSNIEKTLKKLDIDLFTYVVDWEEFKDLQYSFLKASTPDGEIPSDHGIYATLYKIAAKYGINFIIYGNNFKTEGVMPRLWAYGHIDWKYIKSIHKLFGKTKLKTFPYFTTFKFLWYSIIKRIKIISILNYIDYDKNEAMKVLENDLDWIYYGGKHYESNYTKYYQGILLPQKFKIDKRKLHQSALILCGATTREEALVEIQKPAYPPEKVKEDTEYVIKKFGITDEEYNNILHDKIKNYTDYPSHYKLHRVFRNFLLYLRKHKLFYS